MSAQRSKTLRGVAAATAPTRESQIAPSPPRQKSGSERSLIPTSESGKQLYAIAYMYKVRPDVWRGDFLYVHADSAEDARLQYFQSNDPEIMKRMHVTITGVAPVIGFFVNDEHGDKLSV